MLDWPARMKTFTGFFTLSGFETGCSAARPWTVLRTVTASSANAVSLMDESANARRVRWFGFIFGLFLQQIQHSPAHGFTDVHIDFSFAAVMAVAATALGHGVRVDGCNIAFELGVLAG